MNNRVSYRGYRGYASKNNAEMVVFKTLSEVEHVLNELEKYIKSNGYATLSNYYELTGGIVVDNDSKVGWKDLMNVNISSTRYGYLLNMPLATALYVDPNVAIKTAIDILDNADTDSLEDAANDVREILNDML